ncbi:PLP-dependent aminotransferase family protein [Rhodococcus ruber]|uniref:PLP-dependent aminotransferase family protein n=1 Tax=Rhodococcus ruber TaxID=1830 RepID=A0ABT4M866_9NOCA|nr:PLP-dependent aminotransferase family protein [Rhodococcus ruber]MCZ4517147.1 PLP-dependent aminotransferase family protein [Rhodococcus ruber]
MLTTALPPTRPTRSSLPRLFDTVADTINLAGGLPDPELFPSSDISDAMRSMLRLGGRTLLQYSTYRMPDALAAAITGAMEFRGASVNAAHLVPTAGSQNGLLTVALAFAGSGATVLCETPIYPGAAAAFRTAGLHTVAVESDREGPTPESIRTVAADVRRTGGRPVLLYTNPTFHNPTGRSLSADRRGGIVEAAASAELTVIEDDPYALLSFPGVTIDNRTAPTLLSLDPQRVIHLGTFSKILAPGLRCGWIESPAALADELRTVAEITTLSPASLAQATVGRYYAKHGWLDLVDAFRTVYARRAALMDTQLAERLDQGEWEWQSPRGGFYIWLRRRDGYPTASVVEHAEAQGVSVVGGSHFSIADEHADGIRLSFSHVPDGSVVEAVTRFAAGVTAARADETERAAS